MGKKKMATRTTPKKAISTTVEDVPARPRATTGRRKVVIEEEPEEEMEIGKPIEPKPLQSVKPRFEVREGSKRVKGKMIVRLNRPVEEQMEGENVDVNRVVCDGI
ncbi:uncharacterized protein LOC141645806 [Silene latifolia]|uniref:uncharacterized protein LOC141645806 n=1 Tax=Silene latifolia TaxID=37657 RepID=UPI003D773F28